MTLIRLAIHNTLAILVGLTFSLASVAELPKEFKASYTAKLAGFNISASRELHTLEDGSQELRAKATSFFAKIEEFSRFNWSEQEHLIPLDYEYHRTGLGRDRHAVLTFDWDKKRVTNNVQSKPWKMKIVDSVLDKLSYQLQLQHDITNALLNTESETNKEEGENKLLLEYQIADGGKIKTYQFENLGSEILETPLGKINTVKIKKVRKDKTNRITYFWLAPEWDHLLVQLHQKESDGKNYQLYIAQAEVAGQSVKGF